MKKKQKKQQEENGRELDLLSAYYPVDRKKKLVKAGFHVDSLEELLSPPAAPGLRAPLKEDFFETCMASIAPFPEPYCLEAEVVVSDWGDHTPREFAQTVRDAMEMRQNTKRLQGRKVLFLSAIFVIVGFFILAVLLCGQDLGWFGTGFSAELWNRALDTVGTVLLWEAAFMVFLDTSERSVSEPKLYKRLAYLTFRRPDGSLLYRISNKQLFHHTNWFFWLKRIVRDCILISSCGFVVSGINGMMSLFQMPQIWDGTIQSWIGGAACLLFVCQILAGVGGFYLFWGRHNGLTAFSRGYAVVLLVIVALMMVVMVGTSGISQILWVALSFFLNLLFVFSLLLDEKISAMALKPMEDGEAEGE